MFGTYTAVFWCIIVIEEQVYTETHFLPYGLLTRHLRMPAVIYRRLPTIHVSSVD